MTPDQIRAWLVEKHFVRASEVKDMSNDEVYAMRDYLLGVRSPAVPATPKESA